mmetsp:Transcript_78493/g.138211  ORF Transcript_78493/g.138211 Transcript_78493/m.138211 type:complete len:485 (+) Transcript_78493:89-1543(+)
MSRYAGPPRIYEPSGHQLSVLRAPLISRTTPPHSARGSLRDSPGPSSPLGSPQSSPHCSPSPTPRDSLGRSPRGNRQGKAAVPRSPRGMGHSQGPTRRPSGSSSLSAAHQVDVPYPLASSPHTGIGSPRGPRMSHPRIVFPKNGSLDERPRVRRSLPAQPVDSYRERQSSISCSQTATSRMLLQAEVERQQRDQQQKELMEQRLSRLRKVQQECRLRMAWEQNRDLMEHPARGEEQLKLQLPEHQELHPPLSSENQHGQPLVLNTGRSASDCEVRQQGLRVKQVQSHCNRQPLSDLQNNRHGSANSEHKLSTSSNNLPPRQAQGMPAGSSSQMKKKQNSDSCKDWPCRSLACHAVDPEELAMPLSDEARVGRVAEVQRLLKAGAGVNLPDEHGWTPLHWAAIGCHLDVTQVLIQFGADLDARTPDNQSTPLMLAADEGDMRVAQLLLESGAHPYLVSTDGFTAERRCASNLQAQFATLIFNFSK